jgi:hypothetical protein
MRYSQPSPTPEPRVAVAPPTASRVQQAPVMDAPVVTVRTRSAAAPAVPIREKSPAEPDQAPTNTAAPDSAVKEPETSPIGPGTAPVAPEPTAPLEVPVPPPAPADVPRAEVETPPPAARPAPIPEPRAERPAPRPTGKLSIYFDADSSTFDRRGRRAPLRVEVYVGGRKVMESSDPEKQEFDVAELPAGTHEVVIVPHVGRAEPRPRRLEVAVEPYAETRLRAVLHREEGEARISKVRPRDR